MIPSTKKLVLKCLVLLVFCTGCISHAQVALEKPMVITGKVVSIDGEPIANAIVAEKGTFNETQTNDKGFFNLAVNNSRELLISAFLMYPKSFTVSENSNQVEIVLTADLELLESVELRKFQEKKRRISSYTGKKKKSAIGYSIDRDQEEFISDADTDLYSVFRKVPGVLVNGIQGINAQPEIRFFRNRGINAGPPLIVVDGIPTANNILGAIDPANVVDITTLRGLSATTLYGSQGVNGVILIKTRATDFSTTTSKPASLLVKGNNFNEVIPSLKEIEKDQSKPYLKILQKAANADEALAIYNELKNEPQNKNVPFYVSVANHFADYGDLYTHKVLSDLFYQTQDNPRILKTIVFTLEEKGMTKPAIYVLEHFVEKYPSNIQLYRDLAKLYADAGRYNIAANLYKQMVFNKIPNVDFTPIETIIFNEFRHLIAHHKNKIDYKNIPNEFLIANFKKDIRIVVEYTNPQAEFEVQFVNPKKKFYTWNHTYFDNPEIIDDEINKGYAIKEFIVDDTNYGNWLVNIKQTKSFETATPAYVKYTLYKNYGTPSETKEVKVINLSEHPDKVMIDSFYHTGA